MKRRPIQALVGLLALLAFDTPPGLSQIADDADFQKLYPAAFGCDGRIHFEDDARITINWRRLILTQATCYTERIERLHLTDQQRHQLFGAIQKYEEEGVAEFDRVEAAIQNAPSAEERAEVYRLYEMDARMRNFGLESNDFAIATMNEVFDKRQRQAMYDVACASIVENVPLKKVINHLTEQGELSLSPDEAREYQAKIIKILHEAEMEIMESQADAWQTFVRSFSKEEQAYIEEHLLLDRLSDSKDH